MKKIIVGMFTLCLLVIACSKTNEVAELQKGETDSTTNPTNPCDTVNMKYAADVEPIISANCYSCHGNGQADGAISLDSYNKLKRQAASGLLIGVISHASGYDPMPQGAPKLSDCDIDKIKDWVASGTPNN